MILNTIADGVVRTVEGAQDTINEALFEPVIRLGVTGLARAGKTVFITSLVASLIDRNRMGNVAAVREGRIEAAYLQPQPDDTVPRFEYEAHLAGLSGANPTWPSSTRTISELRLSLRVRSGGMLSGLRGPRTIHLDIVDYPGEWLLDLGLLDQSYADWSDDVIARLKKRPHGADYAAALGQTDIGAKFDENVAQSLAATFTDYLHANRAAGLSDCTPGRFLLPGDLAGSPAVTFAPLPDIDRPGRGSIGREMERRFEAYKAQVVRPFFRDHFARLDRQIVLADVLTAIHHGPEAVEDMRRAMTSLLGAFRPGQSAFLTRLLMGRRVDKILFAATKADHLHHKQHDKLRAITQALVADARHRAEFAGAETQGLALAALRATSEASRKHDGRMLDLVQGTLLDGRRAALHAGDLPEDPAAILDPARAGADKWLDADYDVMAFAPPALSRQPGEGPPHIRLDRAVEYLIGDKL